MHAAKLVTMCALLLAALAGRADASQGSFYPFVWTVSENRVLEWVFDVSTASASPYPVGAEIAIVYDSEKPVELGVSAVKDFMFNSPNSVYGYGPATSFNQWYCSQWGTLGCKSWSGAGPRNDVCLWTEWHCSEWNLSTSSCATWSAGGSACASKWNYARYSCTRFNQTFGQCESWAASDTGTVQYLAGYKCTAFQDDACTEWTGFQPQTNWAAYQTALSWNHWIASGTSPTFLARYTTPSQGPAAVGLPVQWQVNVTGHKNGTCSYALPLGAVNASITSWNGSLQNFTATNSGIESDCDFRAKNYTISFNTSAPAMAVSWSQDESSKSNLSTQFISGTLELQNAANLSLSNVSWRVQCLGQSCAPESGLVDVPANSTTALQTSSFGDFLTETNDTVLDANWTVFINVSNALNFSLTNISAEWRVLEGLNYSLQLLNNSIGGWQDYGAAFNLTLQNHAAFWVFGTLTANDATIARLTAARLATGASCTRSEQCTTYFCNAGACALQPAPTTALQPVQSYASGSLSSWPAVQPQGCAFSNPQCDAGFTCNYHDNECVPEPTVFPSQTPTPSAKPANAAPELGATEIEANNDEWWKPVVTPTPFPSLVQPRAGATRPLKASGLAAGWLASPWFGLLALLVLLSAVWALRKKANGSVALRKRFDNGRVVIEAVNAKADAQSAELEDVVPERLAVTAWSEEPAVYEDTVLGWHLVWKRCEWKKGEEWRVEYALEGEMQDLPAARASVSFGKEKVDAQSGVLVLPNAAANESAKG